MSVERVRGCVAAGAQGVSDGIVHIAREHRARKEPGGGGGGGGGGRRRRRRCDSGGGGDGGGDKGARGGGEAPTLRRLGLLLDVKASESLLSEGVLCVVLGDDNRPYRGGGGGQQGATLVVLLHLFRESGKLELIDGTWRYKFVAC